MCLLNVDIRGSNTSCDSRNLYLLWVQHIIALQCCQTMAVCSTCIYNVCNSSCVSTTQPYAKAQACRYDWYQMGSFVVVSLFAKACLPEQCSFEANPTTVRVTHSYTYNVLVPTCIILFSASSYLASRPGRLKYGLVSIAWVIVHMRELSHPESGWLVYFSKPL